jgi:transcription elongation factor Elf1
MCRRNSSRHRRKIVASAASVGYDAPEKSPPKSGPPMIFNCPTCASAFRCPDTSAGRKIICQNCGQKILIPKPPMPAPTDHTIIGKIDLEEMMGSTVPPQMDDGIDVELAGIQEAPTSKPVISTPTVPTITFRCPHCQIAQAVTADLGGQTVKCGTCKLPVQVPVPQGKAMSAPPPTPAQKDPFAFDDRPLVQSPYRRRNSGNGTVALVMGLLSLLLCALFGPIAIAIGSNAMADDPNDGCAKAGYVLGWISTAILLAGVAYCLLAWAIPVGLLSTVR